MKPQTLFKGGSALGLTIRPARCVLLLGNLLIFPSQISNPSHRLQALLPHQEDETMLSTPLPAAPTAAEEDERRGTPRLRKEGGNEVMPWAPTPRQLYPSPCKCDCPTCRARKPPGWFQTLEPVLNAPLPGITHTCADLSSPGEQLDFASWAHRARPFRNGSGWPLGEPGHSSRPHCSVPLQPGRTVLQFTTRSTFSRLLLQGQRQSAAVAMGWPSSSGLREARKNRKKPPQIPDPWLRGMFRARAAQSGSPCEQERKADRRSQSGLGKGASLPSPQLTAARASRPGKHLP